MAFERPTRTTWLNIPCPRCRSRNTVAEHYSTGLEYQCLACNRSLPPAFVEKHDDNKRASKDRPGLS